MQMAKDVARSILHISCLLIFKAKVLFTILKKYVSTCEILSLLWSYNHFIYDILHEYILCRFILHRPLSFPFAIVHVLLTPAWPRS
jgi:hypothetical protein